MKYDAILVDADNAFTGSVTALFRRMNDFNLAAYYREAKSALGQGTVFNPNLVLVDIDDANNRAMIPAFADTYPNAIILGTLNHWDADKAFESISDGALGCLLKPFDGVDLREAIKLFSRGVRHIKPQTCSFFSAKGRSGKTTLIANLALSIVKQTGDLVAIVDADLQFSDMAIFFDIEPKVTMVDATRDVKSMSPTKLNSYFLPVADKIQVLCGPRRLEYSELIDVESLTYIVRMAQSLFHYVLIDLPSGLSPFSTDMCEIADTIFICGMLNTGFEVNHVKRTLELFELWEHYGKKINVVLSRVADSKQPQLEQELGHKLAAVLPDEFLMVSAANSGKIKSILERDTLMSRKINRLALDIISHVC